MIGHQMFIVSFPISVKKRFFFYKESEQEKILAKLDSMSKTEHFVMTHDCCIDVNLKSFTITWSTMT